ncbi:MAG: AAA family ATPase [Actinophytocola sp.]|nr:AAA family ATPase [Actinophytocola sp.]
MKLAVVGKGGVGKTTTAAVLARTLARDGGTVVALDCDTNPNLGISLGIGDDETERLIGLRQSLDDGTQEHAPSWDSLIDVFGSDAPGGVRLAVVSAMDKPEPGCPCCGLSPEQLLRTVAFDEQTVIADFEAGIGTLTRLEAGAVDVIVLVVAPTAKSIEVARRAAELVAEKQLGRLVVLGNQVRDDADRALITAAFGEPDVACVPHDERIADADRRGVAPFDVAPDADAVLAIAALAGTLRATA